MYKCKVCENEFELTKGNRYVARDESKAGLAVIAGGIEETQYDAFDCPICGCQNVIQERKRMLLKNIEHIKEEDTFDEDESNEDVACTKCVFMTKGLSEYPCKKCKLNGGTEDCFEKAKENNKIALVTSLVKSFLSDLEDLAKEEKDGKDK